MATAYEIQVTEAYIGLLGRAPDPAGLAYWVAQLDAAVAAGQDSTLALKKLTNDIANSPEYTAGAIGTQVPAEGNPSQAQADSIVSSLYLNLFERAATQADKDYWTPQLTGGSTTAPEMTLNLITAAKANTAKPTDGQVLGYKQEAATYYVETVAQEDFSRDSATQAVDPVDGPATLLASKTATDYVSSGVGLTTDLATIGAGNDVTMTGGDDVVTGIVGTGATYSTQNINDLYTGDNDSVTLTGDAGFTFDDISKVENVNVNLADTVGAGFTLDATKVLSSHIKVDVANKVTVAGVELDGDTVVSVTALSTSNLTTTDVTSLTVGVGGGASTITADNDAATLDINGIDANDTTLVLSATTADVDLDGTAATTDAVSISAAGKVALEVDDGGAADDLVENITLSGNGAAVTYTITSNTAAASNLTIAGTQDVTLAGAAGQFNGLKSFTDSSTAGSTGLSVSGANGDLDVSTWGVLSGGVELADDFGTQALTVASGSTVKITADQTGPITLDSNDGALSGSITIDMDNDVNDLVTADVDTLTIVLPNAAISMVDLTAGDNDSAVTISGTNDVSITGNVTSGDLTIATQKAAITGTADVDGNLSITASGTGAAGSVSLGGTATIDNDATISADDVTLAATTTTAGNVVLTATGNDVDTTGAQSYGGNLTVVSADEFTTGGTLSVSNDVTITADDYKATTTVNTLAGSLNITVANDADLNGAVDVDGALTISQTATSGKVDFTGATLNVDNDVSVTGENVTMVAATVNAGSATFVAQNDIDFNGTVAVTGGNLSATTKLASGGTIDADGFKLQADNDITLTAADNIAADQIVTVDGNVTLTASNEVVIDAGVGALDVDGTLTINSTSADATSVVTIKTGAVDAENDVTISAGNAVEIDSAINVSSTGNITITATNDVELGIGTTGTLTTTSGNITVSTTTAGAGFDVKADAAADEITASNDITITSDDILLGNLDSTKAGNIVITAANDIDLDGTVKNQTSGNITITASEAVAGAGNTIDAAGNITGENDITITSTAGGEVQLNAVNVKSDTAGDITISGGQIDGSGTFTADKGDITINATNDTETSTIGTLTADLGKVQLLSGNFGITAINASAGGITIAGDAQGTIGAAAAENSEVRLTTTNDVTFTTIDASAVVGSGGGDYNLGTVSSSTETTVSITTGAGNDTFIADADEKYIATLGDGIDTVTGTDSAAGTVINTGGGDDLLTVTSANFLGTVDMGDGTNDKVVLPAGGVDISAGAVWQNIEILQLAANITVSAAHLANDASFEIQGTNSTITATGVTSLDLSTVDFQVGNSANFNLTGTAAANTITGSDAVDVIAGGDGNDTLTGGLSNDSLTGGAGADTLDGGAGTSDTVFYSDVTAANSHGLANLSGVAINLSSAAVTAATVATAMGGTIVLGGGAGAAGADLAAGTAGYLATSAANSTTTMVRDSISNTENITGSDLGDYIVGSSAANAINGGTGVDIIIGGAGADAITTGTGADKVYYTADADAGTLGTLATGQGDAIDNSWVQNSDKLGFIGDFAFANMAGTTSDGVSAIANAAGIDFNAAAGLKSTFIVAGNAGNTAVAGDLVTIADLAAAIGALANVAAGDERIIIFNAATDAKAAIYKFTAANTNGALEAGELQLLGIVDDNAIAAGDIVFT